MRHVLIAFLAIPALSLTLAAQQPIRPSPDFGDVSYGPFAENVLDVWKAKTQRSPLVVFIHGGGFRRGDKADLPTPLLEGLLNRGISVASINYRLTNVAAFPAPMLDGARAVQFLRSKAREWGLDPDRIGATGTSAGAGIALWVGFHSDLADPLSSDPVHRQSTRIQVAAVQNAQTSYDPRWIRANIGAAGATHSALKPFYALPDDELDSPRARKMYEDASPMSYLRAGAPPVFMYYANPSPLLEDAEIHSIKMGHALRAKMDVLKIECVVRAQNDYASRRNLPQTFWASEAVQEMVAFFSKYLLADSGR